MSTSQKGGNKAQFGGRSRGRLNPSESPNWSKSLDLEKIQFPKNPDQNSAINQTYRMHLQETMGGNPSKAADPQIGDLPLFMPANSLFHDQDFLQAYLLLVQGSSNGLLSTTPDNYDKPNEKPNGVNLPILSGLTLGFGLVLLGFQTGNLLFTFVGSLVILTAVAHYNE